jgi:hypothetical protein
MGGLVILAWPRVFVAVTFTLLLCLLVFPSATQVLAGGYGSGVMALPWTTFAPLGAASGTPTWPPLGCPTHDPIT